MYEGAGVLLSVTREVGLGTKLGLRVGFGVVGSVGYRKYNGL